MTALMALQGSARSQSRVRHGPRFCSFVHRLEDLARNGHRLPQFRNAIAGVLPASSALHTHWLCNSSLRYTPDTGTD